MTTNDRKAQISPHACGQNIRSDLPCPCTHDLHNSTLEPRVTPQNTLHTADSSRDDKDDDDVVAAVLFADGILFAGGVFFAGG